MDIVVFKVWNNTRDLKTTVIMKEYEENLLLRLIAKASEKMEIFGVELVLESDGTKIDEDEVLKLISYEVFILLQSGENWKKPESLEQDTNLTYAELFGYDDHTKELRLKEPRVGHRHHNDDSTNCMCKFVIPWEEMFSSHILEACEMGKRDKRLVTHIIHGVVNKMRETRSCFASQSQASKMVTKQIISRFPLTFQEIDVNGVIVGDGSRTVYKKLIDRQKNLNRYMKKHLSIF